MTTDYFKKYNIKKCSVIKYNKNEIKSIFQEYFLISIQKIKNFAFEVHYLTYQISAVTGSNGK